MRLKSANLADALPVRNELVKIARPANLNETQDTLNVHHAVKVSMDECGMVTSGNVLEVG